MIDYYKKSKESEQSIIEDYRFLHRHPELSGREYRTQEYILSKLREWNVECKAAANTGVYAIIRGKRPGHTIALRADMDALPISEENEHPYVSLFPGIMHACGHDAHMAMLLAAARLLRVSDVSHGNIVFLFQPSEERDGGARQMIEAGVLDDPKVELAAAFHMWLQPAHSLSCIPGPVMAQPDAFRIKLFGKGGHGAAPHLCKNPIPALAALVQAIGGLLPLFVSAKESAVLSICSVHCGDSYNVVSEEGVLEGTIRTYDRTVREDILQALRGLAKSIPEAYGLQSEFELDFGHPPTHNDVRAAKWAYSLLKERLCETAVYPEGEASMLGEDFSYFSERCPILYMRLGYQNAGLGSVYPLHHKLFKIDESVLAAGAAAFCILASDFTKNGFEQRKDV